MFHNGLDELGPFNWRLRKGFGLHLLLCPLGSALLLTAGGYRLLTDHAYRNRPVLIGLVLLLVLFTHGLETIVEGRQGVVFLRRPDPIADQAGVEAIRELLVHRFHFSLCGNDRNNKEVSL